MRTFIAFAAVTIALIGLAVLLGEREQVEVIDDNTPDVASTDRGFEPLPDDTPKPTPTTEFGDENTVDEGSLTITTRLSHGAVPATPFSELYATIDVLADEVAPDTRAPLNVALVIDRSGSMRGEAMAQARQAARTFVDALDDRDRVAIVAFDNRSVVEMPSTVVDEEGRSMLHRSIDKIHAGGTTNISGGLRDGYQEVQRNSRPDMLDRVVLMTDGIPNVGLTTKDELSNKTAEIRRSGVTVTTLGFGTSYDASLMAAMATEGAGNFRHISDAADLELAFADEISDLQQTVASGIQLDFLPAPGVEIERIYGFSEDDVDGGKRITLGELQTEGRRSAVVRLRVDEGRVGDHRDLIDVRANYIDRLADAKVSQKLSAGARVVADRSEVRQSVDSDVMARVEEVRSQESMREVIDLYASGDRRQAEQRLRRERQRVQQVRVEYDIADDSESSRRIDGAFDRIGSAVRSHAPRSSAGREEVAEEQVQLMDSVQGR